MTLGFMSVRLVTKEAYAYANVQISLYMSLSMYFAREAVRKAAIREMGDNRSIKSSFNLMQLTLPINLLITVLTTAYILLWTTPDPGLDYFVPSMICFAASIVVQCFTEVYYVYMTIS
jgi:hypothetical protein